jgi:hypothetical protein
LNILSDLLARIPYKELPRKKIRLPKRTIGKSHTAPQHMGERIKERF